MLSDQDMHERMVNGWRMGRPFTDCGNGSLPQATANIRRVLPEWVRNFGWRTVNDAGAGDMKWLEGMTWDVVYRPFDLIVRNPNVLQIDITTETMPPADVILCRMVLNHLDDERVGMALDQFAGSAPYLLATHFVGGGVQRTTQFMRLDLTRWLGEPIQMTPDGTEENCRLALWRF